METIGFRVWAQGLLVPSWNLMFRGTLQWTIVSMYELFMGYVLMAIVVPTIGSPQKLRSSGERRRYWKLMLGSVS